MKIAYVFHGHFPDHRAAALFAAQEAKSLASLGDIELLVPMRARTNVGSARILYGIPSSIKIKAISSLELLHIPILRGVAFLASLLTFSVFLFSYIKKTKPEWTVTFDHATTIAAALAGSNVLLEIHDFPTRWNPMWRLALRSSRIVLSTNRWKRDMLIRRFNLKAEKIFIERNGVNLAQFAGTISKHDAREALGLRVSRPLVVYTGHVYAWKGVDTLVDAASLTPAVEYYLVGGGEEEIEEFKSRNDIPPNVHIIGQVAHEIIPQWQAAADVLVLPNTSRQELSEHYTSPMKLFEYMASGRPIVAARIPSVTEIVDDSSSYLFEPDNAFSLKQMLTQAIENDGSAARTIEAARRAVEYSWDARARRIGTALKTL